MLGAIVGGGLACGTLDIIAAFVVYGALGTPQLVLLQFIASGALGRASFQGGLATAALGLVFEYVIAFGAATAFVLATRVLPVLLDATALAGVLYGVFVYYFMQLVVVAHSRAPKQPFSLKAMIIGVVIHIICVGLPIAIAARRGSTRT